MSAHSVVYMSEHNETIFLHNATAVSTLHITMTHEYHTQKKLLSMYIGLVERQIDAQLWVKR